MDVSQEIEKSIRTLQEGKVLLYPTDTVWGIGCDATQEQTVQKIYRIKQRDVGKAMIILVESPERLSRLVKVPKVVWRLIHRTEKPLTIIYENPQGVAPNLYAKDQTLAIRLTKDLFCKTLIQALNKPLVSTSANRSGNPTPLSYNQIDAGLLDEIDYAVNFRRKEKAHYKGSSVVKFSPDGEVQVLRK
ncbi:MAG: L-threonylcarbamoyladenylate synthase [Flavobacteriales bacterium AspAUS03]